MNKIIVSFYILLNIQSFANKPPVLYKPQQLVNDFNYLVKMIKKVHPNCYAYISEIEFNTAIDKTKVRLNRSMTRMEFYKIITPFFELIKDGHSQIYPPTNDVIDTALYFPFKLEFYDRKCFIRNNFSSELTILQQDEVLSINTVPIETIRDSLLLYFNGERPEFKMKVLENYYFERLLFIVYGFKNSFYLKWKNHLTEEEKESAVAGISFEKIKELSDSANITTANDFDFKIDNDSSTAIMKINCFTGNVIDFTKFYNKCFQQIKNNGTQNLIIDIRKNGGGNSSYSDSLLNYLTDSSYSQFSVIEVKNTPKAKYQLKRVFPFIYKLIPFCILFPKTASNCYKIKNSLKRPKNNDLRFRGNLYVLTSEYTFSSASNFACTIKDFNIGKIIGQETGGLASSYGPAIEFKLPNTKINFQVSYQHVLRPAGYDDGRGVIPDYFIDDISLSEEQYYNKVYEYIKNNK